MSDATRSDSRVRRATAADAATIGRMLHEFNSEFGDFTPGAEFLGRRLGVLMDEGVVDGFLAGEGPDGFLTVRLFPAVQSEGLDAYVEELYVVPRKRGEGLGRALLETAMAFARERGAGNVALNTAETDDAARGLYESLGFTNREGGPDGPPMLYYEREL